MYLMIETLSFVLVMVFVAFFILSERKVMGYMQLRKGPNKAGVLGLLQSFADLMKLVLKSKTFSFQYRSMFSLFGTYLIVFMSLFYCNLYGLSSMEYKKSYLLLVFFVLTSLSSYGVLSVGWGSKNKYSLYGSLRSSFGAMSYEMSFMCYLIIMGTCYSMYTLYDDYFKFSQNSLVVLLWPILVLFLFCSLCETNRIPFDFAESESDLVSGFNTEYCNLHFVCLFACEYLMVYMMCWFSCMYFFSGLLFYLIMLPMMVFFMWSRATLPRLYYNYFISFFWVYLLVFLSWFVCLTL